MLGAKAQKGLAANSVSTYTFPEGYFSFKYFIYFLLSCTLVGAKSIFLNLRGNIVMRLGIATYLGKRLSYLSSTYT